LHLLVSGGAPLTSVVKFVARFNFQAVLQKHVLKHLFEVERKPKAPDNPTRYVVAFSERLILLHRLEWNVFCLDGYTVIRDHDIRLFRFFDRSRYWQFRAARKAGLKPVPPKGISLAGWPELLTSARDHFPLLSFCAEKRYPDICFVGFWFRFQTTRKFEMLTARCSKGELGSKK